MSINEQIAKSTSTGIFILMFSIYYGHYLVYLFLGYSLIQKAKNNNDNSSAIQWLCLLFYALAALWLVYVSNLLEETIPYILGPILYSVIAYGVSLIAIRKGYIGKLDTKYKTTPSSETEIDELYLKLKALMTDEGLYANSNLTLSALSKLMKTSPQKISMTINIKFRSNFNGFINHYRVQKAQAMMVDPNFANHTIASIAFEVGFNSLTSFNSAFKKETDKTPSAYRKEI